MRRRTLRAAFGYVPCSVCQKGKQSDGDGHHRPGSRRQVDCETRGDHRRRAYEGSRTPLGRYTPHPSSPAVSASALHAEGLRTAGACDANGQNRLLDRNLSRRSNAKPDDIGMVHQDWRDAARALGLSLEPFDAEQRELAELLGVSLPDATPARVAAALIRRHLAGPLRFGPDRPVSPDRNSSTIFSPN